MGRRSFALAVLGMFFFTASHARTLQQRQDSTSPTTESTPVSKSDCSYEGVSDMYGIGIRLGPHLQPAALILVAALKQNETATSVSFSNLFFQLSVLVGLSYLTVTDSEFRVVDAAISVFIAQCAPAAGELKIKFSGGVLKFFRHSLLPTLSWASTFGHHAYAIWFWFRGKKQHQLLGLSANACLIGIDQLAYSTCPSYGFFFSRVTFSGWFRTLGKVHSVLVLLLFIVSMMDYGFAEKFCCQSWKDFSESFDPGDGLASQKDGVPRWQVAYITLRTFFYLLSVELMIRWNNIDGVNSMSAVGQMMPFFVGCGSVLTTLAVQWPGSGPEAVAS